MSAMLTVIHGPDAGRFCDVLPGCVLVIGRGRNCGLQLSDPGVSRIHCRLIADADAVRLEDTNSRFGTLVNRRPVTLKILQSGDTIAIGDTELQFHAELLPQRHDSMSVPPVVRRSHRAELDEPPAN